MSDRRPFLYCLTLVKMTHFLYIFYILMAAVMFDCESDNPLLLLADRVSHSSFYNK